jgi:5-formyltetrahydrofolate cyclo-ligase
MGRRAPKSVSTGTARYEATKIPEAIKYPRGLSLSGPWSGAHGSHLTFVASEDFRQTATVVPSLPFDLSKDSLRKSALEARKAFVRTLDDGHRAILERRLAEHLTSLCAHSSVVAGYAPFGTEISPMLAMEEARAVGRIVAFPAFSDPSKPFRFHAGDPLEPGPFGMMQPKRRAPAVEPDLIFVPLVAVDGQGTRLGRGKGHYDRALLQLKKSGAKLIGVGWPMQRLDSVIPKEPWDIPLHGFASPDGIEYFE